MSNIFKDFEDIEIRIVCADALAYAADIFVAKRNFQEYRGVSAEFASLLLEADCNVWAATNGVRFISTGGILGYPVVLFLEVGSFTDFSYPDIREFAARALREIRAEAPYIRHIATTAHGPGFGLDETEALLALCAGFADAVRAGDAPPDLSVISLIERDQGRAARLRRALGQRAPSHGPDQEKTQQSLALETGISLAASIANPVASRAGSRSNQKPAVFVAMSFGEEFDDTFFLGIQDPARQEGFVCERMDHDIFAGDIIEEMKRRIELASVVVGEISSPNPNVYLEIGYAWGRERPTLLLIKEGQRPSFDVQGQKLITYRKIVELRDMIRKGLKAMREQGIIC